MTNPSSSPRRGLVFIAALLLLLALVAVVSFAKLNKLIDANTAMRFVGGLFSLLMIGAGNLLPKYAKGSGAEAARVQKTSLFAGLLLVAGGLISLGLWVWAPEDIRALSATATALSAFAVALLAAALQLRFSARSESTAEARPRLHAQSAVLHILHALMWAFAIFLGAALGDRQAVLWLTIGFTMSISLLQVVMGRPARRGC